MCWTMLRTFYDMVVASAIFYTVVCRSSERDKKRLHKMARSTGSVLGCSSDSTEEVCERRMLAKLTCLVNNSSHPQHDMMRDESVNQLIQQ